MELIANLAAQHRLPPSHRRIVCAATESSSHDVICAKLDISRNTLKTHIRQILERTGAHSLERLVAPLRALVLRL
jgi:DNA-binding CsgD family transcriptional regulator